MTIRIGTLRVDVRHWHVRGAYPRDSWLALAAWAVAGAVSLSACFGGGL